MSWKIIIVEDFQPDIILLKKCLNRLLKEPTIFVTEKKAVFKLLLKQNTTVDVILCDFHLPESTGREFWEIAQDISPSTPFIYITGDLDPTIANETILAEAYSYIIKRSFERLQGDVAQLISKILIDRISSRNSLKSLELNTFKSNENRSKGHLFGYLEEEKN